MIEQPDIPQLEPAPENPELIALRERVGRLEAENKALKEENERLKKENSELERVAMLDPLTETFNLRGFESAVQPIMPRIEREKEQRKEGKRRSMTVMMCDIDNFKTINDLYGHPIGDIAIKEASNYLRHSVRKGDVVGRKGGDEFLVAFTGAVPQDIINKFYNGETGHEKAELNFEIEIAGERVTLTMSCGVVEAEPGESLDQAIARADKALYDAKAAGKNIIMIGTKAGEEE